MKKLKGILLVVLGATLLILYASFYIVDETEQVVITQFGRVIGTPKVDSGINFKIPFIQQANYFPKNLLEWDGDPGQVPTHDKTYIWVDTFARWKIQDPVKFFQTVNNTYGALSRLDDIIDPAVRNFITSFSLIESVKKSNRAMDILEGVMNEKEKEKILKKYHISTGRVEIAKKIMEQAKPKLERFGIKLVDIKIKRINYVESVRRSVYERMIAERRQVAEKFRAEGNGEAQKWLGKKDKELKKIQSEAYKTAQIIKGAADAKVTKILAKAFNRDPSFYSFVKTLDVYKKSLGKNSTMVISTDSEFLKYLNTRKE